MIMLQPLSKRSVTLGDSEGQINVGCMRGPPLHWAVHGASVQRQHHRFVICPPVTGKTRLTHHHWNRGLQYLVKLRRQNTQHGYRPDKGSHKCLQHQHTAAERKLEAAQAILLVEEATTATLRSARTTPGTLLPGSHHSHTQLRMHPLRQGGQHKGRATTNTLPQRLHAAATALCTGSAKRTWAHPPAGSKGTHATCTTPIVKSSRALAAMLKRPMPGKRP